MTAVIACGSGTATAASLDIRFTRPTCGLSPRGIADVHCDSLDDWRNTYEANLPLAEMVEDLVSRESVTRIAAMSYYLGEGFVDLLVDTYSTRSMPLRVATDSASIALLRQRLSEKVLAPNDLAHDLLAQSPHDANYAFHPKVVLAEYDGGESYGLMFTSGNFRLSTRFRSHSARNYNTANFENYGFYHAAASDPLIARHHCLLEALERLNDDEDSRDAFSGQYQVCVHHRDLPREVDASIDLFVLPTETEELLSILGFHLGRARRIRLAGYNAGNPLIARLLKAAMHHGALLQVVTDDDACRGPLPEEDRDWYSGLRGSGATVRYITTNSDTFSSGALTHRFHHKFMIIEAESDAVVLTGSANFTRAGFGANVESAYLIGDSGAVAAFQIEFERYFERLAVPAEAMGSCD
ncbi:MAG: phospholipase D-like domain-containing protein [Myxococcota bacterium]